MKNVRFFTLLLPAFLLMACDEEEILLNLLRDHSANLVKNEEQNKKTLTVKLRSDSETLKTLTETPTAHELDFIYNDSIKKSIQATISLRDDLSDVGSTKEEMTNLFNLYNNLDETICIQYLNVFGGLCNHTNPTFFPTKEQYEQENYTLMIYLSILVQKYQVSTFYTMRRFHEPGSMMTSLDMTALSNQIKQILSIIQYYNPDIAELIN